MAFSKIKNPFLDKFKKNNDEFVLKTKKQSFVF